MAYRLRTVRARQLRRGDALSDVDGLVVDRTDTLDGYIVVKLTNGITLPPIEPDQMVDIAR